jgi:hypothetical protein
MWRELREIFARHDRSGSVAFLDGTKLYWGLLDWERGVVRGRWACRRLVGEDFSFLRINPAAATDIQDGSATRQPIRMAGWTGGSKKPFKSITGL